MRPALLLALFSSLLTDLPAGDTEVDDRLAVAAAYLDEHRLHPGQITPPADYDQVKAEIAATADPETQFGPFIFALARPATGILDESQLAAMAAVIEARKSSPVNWHDVRNVIRVQSMQLLFPHALATDPSELERLQGEWTAWTHLRLAYMFQEFVAQERFQRAAWAVLNAGQKTALLAGDYDSKIKKNTGHSRGFFADRIVTKALGKPDHADAFANTAGTWRTRWESVQAKMESSAQFSRQREFAMDQADETFALATWPEESADFHAFAAAERDAIRDLVQAGYDIDDELKAKVAALIETQRADAVLKYSEHAHDLLQRLGERPKESPKAR